MYMSRRVSEFTGTSEVLFQSALNPLWKKKLLIKMMC